MNLSSAARFRIAIGLILVVYAVGLTRGLSEPWTGLHDWNGAFFSQLARNFLRYPFSMHHGMPVVAMGRQVPLPDECSYYPRHPPALVWLVAAAFAIVGESEAAARAVSVGFSVAGLALLIQIVARVRDRATALAAGAIYALMPMTVFFGRMVDHEPICLFCMLAAIACWQRLEDARTAGPARSAAFAGWSAAIVGMVWIDWPGLLFSGLFFLALIRTWKLGRMKRSVILVAGMVIIVSCVSILAYLVNVGFKGRWLELVAMFQSRREPVTEPGWSAPFGHIVRNLTWPVLIAALTGIAILPLARFFAKKPLEDINIIAINNAPFVGLGLLLLTGLVWALAFWRQFQIHEYWMFYLGPPAAAGAACAFGIAYRYVRKRTRAADALALLAAVAIIMGCVRGTNDYFAKVSYPPKDVLAWKGAARATNPDERIVLNWNPIRSEWHGAFEFRNIVPPQMTYYLDRAFVVVTDKGELDRLARAGKTVVMFGP